MKRLALLLLLAACAGKPVASAAPPPIVWQKDVREADRKRIAGLWNAWTRSLAQVAAEGKTAALKALGPVADAEGALNLPPPPPGTYLCRDIRIGRREGMADNLPTLGVAPFQPCVIRQDAGRLWLEQGPGMQRVGGQLYPDGDRLVFLGSMALVGEMAVMRYGADPDRNQAGVLRAIGDHHWRLELPWPNWQANLHLIEIVPA